MKILTLALTLTIGVTNGLAFAATSAQDMSQHQMGVQYNSGQARHEGEGVLKAVNTATGKIQIAHEAITELGWPPMTMWFALRDPLPNDFKIGDTVRFELQQEINNQWVIIKILHN